MKATLIKENDFYYLFKDKKIIAEIDGHPLKSITGKLSKQNCDEIFGVVDVEKLAEEYDPNYAITDISNGFHFIEGFNKAMELNKDKLFTSSDILNAYMQGTNDGAQFESLMDYDSEDFDEAHEFAEEAEKEFRESIQRPTEIEVEIEMKKVVDERKTVGAVKGVYGSGHKITTYKSVPKLDKDGCIILKKTEQ